MQIADMAIGIQAGRQMMYHAAWLHSQDKPCSLEGAMAKVFCPDMCLKVCELGMQVLGGQFTPRTTTRTAGCGWRSSVPSACPAKSRIARNVPTTRVPRPSAPGVDRR